MSILVVSLFLTSTFKLYRIQYIIERVIPLSIFALVMVFYPELRRALVSLGYHRIFSGWLSPESRVVDEVIKAVMKLSKKKIGALIVLERDVRLGTYIEGGVRIDAEVKSELLETIFYPGTALHDGGVIIRHDRIAAAGCLFPLSDNPEISKTLGARHRAGLGITEESDALCVIVSEETGTVSIAVRGKLTRDLDKDGLEKMLKELYAVRSESEHHVESPAEVAELEGR